MVGFAAVVQKKLNSAGLNVFASRHTLVYHLPVFNHNINRKLLISLMYIRISVLYEEWRDPLSIILEMGQTYFIRFPFAGPKIQCACMDYVKKWLPHQIDSFLDVK